MVDVTALAVVLGIGIAAGIQLVISGWHDRSPEPARIERLQLTADVRHRAVVAVLAGGLVGLLTRWPVAVLGVGALGWFSRELFGSRAARDRAVARTEAIA